MAGKGSKGYKGIGMEGPIARWYATGAGQRDARRVAEEARQVAACLPGGGQVLEVGPGPGLMAIELARTGKYQVTGLDISTTFVEIARRNAAAADVAADFRHGNAASMPFEDESFDLVACCAAFKNFAEPVQVLREMQRVLRPSGRAIVIDLRHDVSRRAVRAEVERMSLGPAARVLTSFTLRSFQAHRAYTRDQFDEFIARSRFAFAGIRQTPVALEVHMQK
ncbi:MAG TPA: class I SAM-dependent methyltransferase [Streptosporangiaceae bacterium]|jgi:ubiquinone/menaquinone biosynthesis C-methylase UbiE